MLYWFWGKGSAEVVFILSPGTRASHESCYVEIWDSRTMRMLHRWHIPFLMALWGQTARGIRSPLTMQFGVTAECFERFTFSGHIRRKRLLSSSNMHVFLAGFSEDIVQSVRSFEFDQTDKRTWSARRTVSVPSRDYSPISGTTHYSGEAQVYSFPVRFLSSMNSAKPERHIHKHIPRDHQRFS